MENSSGALTIPPTEREKRGTSSRSAKFLGNRCQVTSFSLDMETQPVRRTSKRHTSATRLKHASSVSIQLFTSFFILFQKIFYSHWEYLYSSSGAPSPRRQRCARVITRTSRNKHTLRVR